MTNRQALLTLLVGIGLLTATPHAVAEDKVVTIDNFTFKPAQIRVAPGTTITFKNGDDIPHSVVATDGSFHSAALDTGDQFSHKFEKAGEFSYFCGLHPHMQGKITVAP